MIRRHQLAVCPRISPGMLLRSMAAALWRPKTALPLLAEELRTAFCASTCVLTDSGTSALVLAFRTMLPRGGVVALPGYGCVDLASAVRFAGVKVRLYDIDPATMSPDLDSVERTLRRGVDAVVVAHFYGYPADVPAVRTIAARHGVPLLEDAAQAAGGVLRGNRLGSLGDASVLSFGRGKGLFGGHGGALLGISTTWAHRIAAIPPLVAPRGGRDVAAGAAQWVFGRPGLYALPASLPWLRLGEMVYHPAHEPGSLSVAAATLVRNALGAELQDRAQRRRVARALGDMLDAADSGLQPVRALEGAEPGFLRFAVRDRSGARDAAPQLGVMHGYPRTLHDQPELRPHLVAGEPATPGAEELRASLLTLPTHAMIAQRDIEALREWICVHTGTEWRRAQTTPSCGPGATTPRDESGVPRPANDPSPRGAWGSATDEPVPRSCESARVVQATTRAPGATPRC